MRAGLAVLEAIDELNARRRVARSVGAGRREHRRGSRLARRAAGARRGRWWRAMLSTPPPGSSRRRRWTGSRSERAPSGRPGGCSSTSRSTRSTRRARREPVAVWRASRPTARFGSDVIRSMTTPLVGRELDFTLLRGTFDKAAGDRSAQLVTVVGEPGVGKCASWRSCSPTSTPCTSWSPGGRAAACPTGKGSRSGRWARSEGARRDLRVRPAEVATEKLEAILPESEDRPWLRARLLPLLGIEPAPAAQEEPFTAWRRFLEAVAERAPAVLVFEDVHWADDALLDFVEHLADWARGVPLLFICTARPELYETRPAWGAGLANQTAIHLSPLSDDDTARLVSALLERAVLPAETERLLLERAGGNPLYAEEFVRMLRDRGLLGESVPGTRGGSVPDSLQALIAARLDTLSQDRKALLQDAAVMGKVFWAGSVCGDGRPRSGRSRAGIARAGAQGAGTAVPPLVDGRRGGVRLLASARPRRHLRADPARRPRRQASGRAAGWRQRPASMSRCSPTTPARRSLLPRRRETPTSSPIRPGRAATPCSPVSARSASIPARPSSCWTWRSLTPEEDPSFPFSFCAGPTRPVRPVVSARPSLHSSRRSSASMLSETGPHRAGVAARFGHPLEPRRAVLGHDPACRTSGQLAHRPRPRVGRRSDRRRERPFPQGHVRGGCRDG